MCSFTIVAFTFLLYENAVFTYTIDQRQTGDLNVQIDLKNLHVIALMKGKEEYVDYDYAYDYSDITIKPQNGTTNKPLNVTETITQSTSSIENKTAVTTILSELETTTKSLEVFTSTTEITTETLISNATIDDASNRTTKVPEPEGCKKGFFRNSHGICELLLQNPSNTLLKMLKQKSKPRGGNGGKRT